MPAWMKGVYWFALNGIKLDALRVYSDCSGNICVEQWYEHHTCGDEHRPFLQEWINGLQK
ncbi:hypothetical protein LCGC14_1719060 [marine sediment metagenome]|uniref:Uncharacterized protein n=1 Tax=marine sediment metagenome TaxID=412755 RepID=A0A0F9HD91_9ZZZZ